MLNLSIRGEYQSLKPRILKGIGYITKDAGLISDKASTFSNLVVFNMHQAQFRIGQVIRHTKQNYRGVIIDVDYSFQPQGIHSPIMIKKNIATEHPWYRVLVDNSNHITYVKETLLEDDSYDDVPICHPDLHSYLEIRNGKYILHQSIN